MSGRRSSTRTCWTRIAVPALAVAILALTPNAARAGTDGSNHHVLSITPSHMRLGTVHIGATGEVDGTLQNTGTSVLSGMFISTFEVFGNAEGDVSYDISDCFALVLAPGETCSFSVFVTPIFAGRITLTDCFSGYDPDRPAVFDRVCGHITGRAAA